MSSQLSETQAKRTQRGLQCSPGASRDLLQSQKAPRRLKQPAPQSHSRRGSPPSIAYMSHPAVAIPYVATRGHLHSPGTAEAGDLLALSIYVGHYPKPPVYRRHQRSSTDLDHHVRCRSSCVIWSRSSALWTLSLHGYGRNDDDDAIDDDDHDDDDDDDDDDDEN